MNTSDLHWHCLISCHHQCARNHLTTCLKVSIIIRLSPKDKRQWHLLTQVRKMNRILSNTLGGIQLQGMQTPNSTEGSCIGYWLSISRQLQVAQVSSISIRSPADHMEPFLSSPGRRTAHVMGFFRDLVANLNGTHCSLYIPAK